MSDQKTHVLTLVKSNGEVKYISRKEALGLSVEDLQDLLELSLCRDENDQSAKEFEAEFKEQAKALLMSNKEWFWHYLFQGEIVGIEPYQRNR